MNIGEEIVAAYLQYVKHCEFIQQNLFTPDVQGEIDVVGINLEPKEIYVCEVAIHLTTGYFIVQTVCSALLRAVNRDQLPRRGFQNLVKKDIIIPQNFF